LVTSERSANITMIAIIVPTVEATPPSSHLFENLNLLNPEFVI
jgi:hypothetical protein